MERSATLPIRLVLLDHDDVARRRSVARLGEDPELEVVGDAAHPAEALRLMRERQPDAILVESRRQDKQGLKAITSLSAFGGTGRPAVVAYMEIIHRDAWPEARAAGADDLLLKELPPGSIAKELRNIVSHRRSVRL